MMLKEPNTMQEKESLMYTELKTKTEILLNIETVNSKLFGEE